MSEQESKYKYRIKGAIGKVFHAERSGVYYLKTKDNSLIPLSAEEGKRILKAEGSSLDMGRPSLFPGKEVHARSISLPKEYWQKMKEPYSISIANILKEHFHGNI